MWQAPPRSARFVAPLGLFLALGLGCGAPRPVPPPSLATAETGSDSPRAGGTGTPPVERSSGALPSPASGPASASPEPTLSERVAEARARLSVAGSQIDERAVLLRGRQPELLHVVLRAGGCSDIEVIAEAPVAVALHDEHDHEIAVDGAPVCPRWTGSFMLRLSAPHSTRAVVLLGRRPSD